MVESPIASVELHRVSLPARREHKWTGLTEPIGGYVLVKIADENGLAGWGGAPVLKDWGGGVGRFFRGNPGPPRSGASQDFAPPLCGRMAGGKSGNYQAVRRAVQSVPH